MPRKFVGFSVMILSILGLILLLVFILSVPRASLQPCYKGYEDTTCYSTDSSPYRLYGTKTNYRYLIQSRSQKAQEFHAPGCSPVLFFLYNRHTIRYPSRNDIEQMQDILPSLQKAILKNSSSLCKEDLEQLSRWELKIVPDDDNLVTDSGKIVAKEEAERLKRMFPSLLSLPYSPSDYVIGFTSRIRTRQTAESFLKGILDGNGYQEALSNFPEPFDDLLQFHKTCDKILKSHGIDLHGEAQGEKFEEGPEFQSLLKTLTARLGVNISKSDLNTIKRMCYFDFAIHDRAPWCAAFTEQDLKVLEYKEDLETYHEDSYGVARNYEQACPVVQDLLYRIGNATRGIGPKVILYFSHAGGFKKLISRFGFFKDEEPLTWDGYCSERSRRWRTSYASPFNANIAFVLFKCSDEYKIAAFVNEQLEVIPGCDERLCPFHKFYSMFSDIAFTCDLSRICSST